MQLDTQKPIADADKPDKGTGGDGSTPSPAGSGKNADKPAEGTGGDGKTGEPGKDGKPADKPAEGTGGDGKTKSGGGSILDDADADGDESGHADKGADWPKDWRGEVASRFPKGKDGKDKDIAGKVLKQLQRYTSPIEALIAGLHAQEKIRSGDLKPKLPDDATEEQIAEYRKAHGIPEAPDKYNVPAVPGHAWTDDDKPLLNSFLTVAHGANLSQEIANELLGWYGKQQVEMAAAREQAMVDLDRAHKAAITDQYRLEWGPEYRAHVNVMNRVLQDANLIDPEIATAFAEARLLDGRRLVNHPRFPGWLTNFALKEYGEGGLIGGESKATMDSREDELVKMRQDNFEEFSRKKNKDGELLSDELLRIRQKKQKKAA